MKKSHSLLKTIHQKITWALHLTPKEFFAYLHFRQNQIKSYLKRRKRLKSKETFLETLQSKTQLRKILTSHVPPPTIFFFTINDTLIKALKPNKQKILEEAEKILNHEFTLLGSGPTNLGPKINWHQDFKSGKTWPLDLSKEIPYEFGTGNDIKVPWDLSRGLQFPTLGQAHLLTKEPKYAYEFESQITDWIKSNPVHFGVNWKCTMDVAIRACNWTFGWEFFKNSPDITEDFKTIFYNSIHQHGDFIIHNLEILPFTSNHYLADIVGLVYLGIMFPEFKSATKWRKKGIKALEEEIRKQVYEDGANFEASISYHRLATELFAYPAILCKLNNYELSPTFWKRLEKMFSYTLNYLKPNGLAPMIGDFDDGRLHVLSHLSTYEPRDHTYLLHIARKLFPKNKSLSPYPIPSLLISGSHPLHDTLLLTQNLPSLPTINPTVYSQKPTSAAFPKTGTYSLRSKSNHIFINAGPNGQKENGGHSHNDTFSFELNKEGKDFIVDTGSYVYTPDIEARNRFRSTKMHNVLCIDSTEINPIDPAQPFHLKETANPKVTTWTSTREKDLLIASHSGYHRLSKPVTHTRSFSFDKISSILELTDEITGQGFHTLEWNFHFTPETKLELKESELIATQENTTLKIKFPNSLKAQILPTEISYSYGKIYPSSRLILTTNIELTSSQSFKFTLT